MKNIEIRRKYWFTLLALLSLAILSARLSTVYAQGTAFTYQGQLDTASGPASGTYNLTFTLYTAGSGGVAVAGPVTNNTVNITNGMFTVMVDFGPGTFIGETNWLQMGVETNGATSFTALTPRQQLTPVPYAIFANTASNLLGTVPAGDFSGVYSSPVTLNNTANSFSGDGTGLVNVNASFLGGLAATNFWQTTGNAGTVPAVNFLGTSDDEPLIFRANNQVGLQLEYASVSTYPIIGSQYGINLIGGFWGNSVSAGVVGGTIAGGGDAYRFGLNESGNSPNLVTGSFGTVGGGIGNSAGSSATVPGGEANVASGVYSFAAGQEAQATNQGAFVWADSQGATFTSSANDSFNVRAQGGANFVTGNAGVTVTTGAGTVQLISESSDIVPSMVISNNNGYSGHLRFRNYMEVWPNLPGTVAGGVDIRNTNGTATIDLNGANGSVTCGSITITSGSDLAEPFAIASADQPISAGEVVVIDPAHPGQLKLTDRPYDACVAGVVSGANGIHPGIQMHQQGLLEGGKNVALSGRVYVQADTSNGAIQPGDLLTTSSTPGRAMRVSDHVRAQGAILGKAMSALNEGRGMVLVLVTLQ